MSASPIADFHAFPDAQGHFGRYGGSFVAETLVGPLQELAQAYDQARQDPAFQLAYDRDLAHYVGRPSPIYHAERLSDHVGGAQILLKREDLNHTGAHKINNTIYRMKLLGATVVPVTSGSATLKDALNEAMRDWVTNVQDTFYIIGTVAGPDPYPRMVRDFNAIVGREAREQMLAEYGRLPDAITACVGGGSNAIGLFHAFLNDREVEIVGAEAAGDGIHTGRHAASIAAGRPGVLHGNRTYVLCDDDGQIIETHSVSAGLDYPGVGPEHAFLADSGRARYVGITDEEALQAFHLLAHTEGILPALESSHALAQAMKLARGRPRDQIVLCNLSGRGDKDVHTIAAREGLVL